MGVFNLFHSFVIFQLSLKSLAFNALTTPDKDSGRSRLQSACINGDIETVNAILNYSPDKLDSAIAMSVKIGHNSPHFPGKSLLTVLRRQSSKKHNQISELVEKVTKHFQSQSLLHLAAKKGNAEHLRRLLDCGEHVDAMSPDLTEGRETPLLLAARYNDEDVVEYLVERGASLDLQDIEDRDAIHHAVMGGKIRNILRLIELGANVLKEDKFNRRSLVHLAAECGHTDVVRLIVEHGADANKASYYGITPIIVASQNGHLETIQVLQKNGCNLHKGDDEGYLPLHYAAEGDHTDVVKFIIHNGGKVEAKTEKGKTVLHLATRLELVSFLVEEGADIHARDDYARTPLHCAAEKGQADTVTYLLNHGANINSRDESGCSALYDALQGGHAAAAITKVLIDNGCDVKLSNDENDSNYLGAGLLSLTAEKGRTDVLELLVQIGFSVDTCFIFGETPLTAAARFGHLHTVAYLLDRGANVNGATKEVNEDHKCFDGDCHSEVNTKDDCGYKFERRKPLYCALEAGQGEVAKLLMERGADTSSSSDGNKYLAELAAMHGFSDILDLVGKDNFRFDNIVNGETLLASAASRGDLESVRFLLQNGANVNAQNMSGDTALRSAIYFPERSRALEIVKLLLASGADINAKNYRSETPLQLACSENFDPSS